MTKRTPQKCPDFEVIGLNALMFLAAEPSRFERFINLTGLTQAEIRARAGDSQFLASILNYLRGDESLLLTFAEQENLDPADIGHGARTLSGGALP
jgi:hypothetical protein